MQNGSKSHKRRRSASIPCIQNLSNRNCGNLIAYWRERRQGRIGHALTQKDLSRLTGIDQKLLSGYEQGNCLPSIDHLFFLAAAMDIPPHVLFASHWKQAREEMSRQRKELGFGRAYPDLPEPQKLK